MKTRKSLFFEYSTKKIPDFNLVPSQPSKLNNHVFYPEMLKVLLLPLMLLCVFLRVLRVFQDYRDPLAQMDSQ